MLQNSVLDEGDIAAGYVLVCQTLPLSARLVLEFDDL
jgi:hypothetical protein